MSDSKRVYPYIPNSVPEVKAQMLKEVGWLSVSVLVRQSATTWRLACLFKSDGSGYEVIEYCALSGRRILKASQETFIRLKVSTLSPIPLSSPVPRFGWRAGDQRLD